MTKTNRGFAFFIAILFIFTMLISACFIVTESDHDCIGENCLICGQINICRRTSHPVCAVLSVFVFAALSGAIAVNSRFNLQSPADAFSLVTLKVKLSD